MTAGIKGDLSLEPRSRSWRLLERERSRKGKDLGVVEDGPNMEGSSGRRTTSKKSDVVEADRHRSCFLENECDRGCELDSEECGLLGESSRYQGHVSSS